MTGIVTSGGTTTLVNNGSITGTGGTAIQFGGTNDVLRMMSGSTVNGNIVGSGTSILQLGGTTAASFDLAKLSGFSNIASLAGSNWSFTGNSTFVGTVNVDGVFTFNGDMSNAGVIVGANGTLGGNGTFGSLIVNGTLAPGNSPGTITTASLTMTAASTYLVQVTGTISDKTIVTGTADIDGKVVVDPLERLTKKTTYTILTAGTLNGTFASTNLLLANNLARNPVLSYVGNDVLLTLDPGLLSPILPANASANNRNVAGAIDTALLGGANLSNAFSAIFNLSGNNLLNGLTQISGETATGSQQTTFNAMNQFMGTMLDPFIDGRGAAPMPAGGSAYADEEALAYAAKRPANDAYAAIYRKAPLAHGLRSPLERVGGRFWRFADHRRQHGARIEQHHQPRCSASRPVRTIASRRTRSPASRWPVAAPISASPMAAAGVPTCSRPAPSSATRRRRPTSPAPSPMAGRTSPPTAP